jgi:hypothetical protein
MATPNQQDGRWQSAWPDAVAFVTVLAVAWWLRASATDLVWSLWLSSLVVGYAIILWSIFRPALTVAAYAWRDRAAVEETLAKDPRGAMLVGGIGIVGGLFLVAFFTVHFGGFHYVHAQFLSSFFPVNGDFDGARPLQGAALFNEVLRRYWVFLPSAFLAERAAFRRPTVPAQSVDVSVTPAAIVARKAANAMKPTMMSPYLKVIRMHVLIFFFAFAHFARLDNFAVYAVVYAVYFFPWRLVASPTRAAQTTPA